MKVGVRVDMFSNLVSAVKRTGTKGKSEKSSGGVPIVLTASQIEMSDFNLNPFIAFTGGFPKIFPSRLLRKYWYPITPSDGDGRAKFAPYGLRKVEALLEEEFGEENVVTCTPQNLNRFVGPDTKVVGISTMDPLGIGFVSQTYTSLVAIGGEPIAAAEFRSLMKHPALKKKRWYKVMVGGSGAWQIVRGGMQDKFKIDTVVIGEAEHVALEIFRKAMKSEKLPRVIRTEKPKVEEISTITRPALFGVTEVTRGCGKGCQFCSPTMRKFYCFPLEKIKKEAELNARAGSKMVVLQTDDIFLYKHRERFVPNREAIVELVNTIGKIESVEYLQPAHAALPPVVCDPKMVEEIAPVLVEKGRWRCNGRKVASVEVGIETGSVELIEKHMRGKPLPLEAKDWPEIVTQAVGILNDNDICPLATLVVGLPGEREEDTIATMELVDDLWGSEIFYVPLFFTSEEECLLSSARQADLRHLTERHWEFFAACWRHNINIWGPGFNRMVWPALALLHPLYYRWKHGSKIGKAMRILGGIEGRPRQPEAA